MLVDAHCHLDDEAFAPDLEAVIARARDAGVQAIITAGEDVASSRASVALVERYESVFAVVGIHPHHAETFDDKNLAEIRTLAAHPKVVGIGEIGIDLHYADGAPRELQVRVFQAQLNLAAQLSKPVVIHDRDAHDAVMEILRKGSARSQAPERRGILHCFSGDQTMANEAISLGYVISFAGNVTFKNAHRLHALADALPLASIVVETDAPYLSPLRGRRNEPANAARVAAKIAELKNIDIALVAQAAAGTCKALFGLPIGQ
jgi:TatD DNase family protein